MDTRNYCVDCDMAKPCECPPILDEFFKAVNAGRYIKGLTYSRKLKDKLNENKQR